MEHVNEQHLHVNKTNFHMKGFALGLALKQRRNATRKSPIVKGKLAKENLVALVTKALMFYGDLFLRENKALSFAKDDT